MTDLLSCPFCGGTNLKSGGDDKFVGVRCLDCEATGPNHYNSRFDWDIRAPAQERQEPDANVEADSIYPDPFASVYSEEESDANGYAAGQREAFVCGAEWARSVAAQCAPQPSGELVATDPLEELVAGFSKALLAKLKLSRANGRSGWDEPDWENECRAGLLRHIEKGDPRDVAAYCAFMWHHDWSTWAPAPPAVSSAAREAIKKSLIEHGTTSLDRSVVHASMTEVLFAVLAAIPAAGGEASNREAELREATNKAVAYFEAKSHSIGEADALLWDLQEVLKATAPAVVPDERKTPVCNHCGGVGDVGPARSAEGDWLDQPCPKCAGSGSARS
jgi:hypothetical protein